MKNWHVVGLLLASLVSSEAALTINFYAGELRTEALPNPPLIPEGSLVYVVASTGDDIFAPPTPEHFVFDDDIIIMSGTVSGGLWADTLNNVTPVAPWNTGDLLQLYWFPSLTSLSSFPTAGMSYGSYRTDLALDSSDIGWVTPEGVTGSFSGALNFVTINGGGSVADPAGFALNTVAAVPEPSAYGLVFGCLSLAGALVFRRIRK